MRATITSDQLSSDLNTALEVLLECACREYELRELGLDGALDADPRWLEIAEKSVRVKRYKVTQIATDFFGKPLDEGGNPGEERIKKLFELAHRLNCNRVQIFGCHDDDLGEEEESDEIESDDDAQVAPIAFPVEEGLDALSAFCEAAHAQKIEVVIRTRNDTCAARSAEAVALINELEQPNLGLDWDVAECFGAGDGSGLVEIDDVLPVLKTVHLRDAVRRGTTAEWASLGKGVIPWEDLIVRLHTEKFKGPVICDPGVAPKLKESRHALVTLARWIDAARFKKPGVEDEVEETPFRRWKK